MSATKAGSRVKPNFIKFLNFQENVGIDQQADNKNILLLWKNTLKFGVEPSRRKPYNRYKLVA